MGLIYYHDNIMIIESHNHNEYLLLYKDIVWWVGYTLTDIMTLPFKDTKIPGGGWATQRHHDNIIIESHNQQKQLTLQHFHLRNCQVL